MKTSQSWIPMVLAGSLGSWQAGRLLWWRSRSRQGLAADEEERGMLMSRPCTIQPTERDCQGGHSCGEVGYERGNMESRVGRGRVWSGVWERGRTKVRGGGVLPYFRILGGRGVWLGLFPRRTGRWSLTSADICTSLPACSRGAQQKTAKLSACSGQRKVLAPLTHIVHITTGPPGMMWRTMKSLALATLTLSRVGLSTKTTTSNTGSTGDKDSLINPPLPPSNKPTAAYDYYGNQDYFQNFRDFADIKGKAKVGRYWGLSTAASPRFIPQASSIHHCPYILSWNTRLKGRYYRSCLKTFKFL